MKKSINEQMNIYKAQVEMDETRERLVDTQVKMSNTRESERAQRRLTLDATRKLSEAHRYGDVLMGVCAVGWGEGGGSEGARAFA